MNIRKIFGTRYDKSLAVQMYKAISSKDYNKVKELLENKRLDPNAEVNGRPLIFHAIAKDEKVALIMIDNDRVDINKGDSEGLTPLMYASTLLSIKVADTLIDYGADLNKVYNKNKRTALFFLVDSLVSAESDELFHKGLDLLRKMILKRADINKRDVYGKTIIDYINERISAINRDDYMELQYKVNAISRLYDIKHTISEAVLDMNEINEENNRYVRR
ncbi:MAG: hypothetical protein ARM1_0677 [Candidatus Micrarchaeota archaeon]|nr:MAG: hypothetical protein ARM1_0677 [Candidatus Micrarchaeota archaeon]